MKAIIFNNYLNHINGAIIDCIEYYLCILSKNKNIKFFIINYNKEFKNILINLIKNRYYINDLNFENNIIEIKDRELIHYKFDKVLIVDYGTINKIKGFISLKNSKSKIYILSDLYTDQKQYLINKKLYPTNSVLYYGEMPYVYKDFQYNMKFLFSRYKSLKSVEPNIFFYSPETTNYDFIPSLNLTNKKIIFKTTSHIENLFESFDTFVYYRNKCFDARPRLFIESFYYNKKILYFNPSGIKDGSYYRYNDIINNGIKYRELNDDDEIIKEFI